MDCSGPDHMRGNLDPLSFQTILYRRIVSSCARGDLLRYVRLSEPSSFVLPKGSKRKVRGLGIKHQRKLVCAEDFDSHLQSEQLKGDLQRNF